MSPTCILSPPASSIVTDVSPIAASVSLTRFEPPPALEYADELVHIDTFKLFPSVPASLAAKEPTEAEPSE